jgi:hypothetical protein
MPKPIWREEVDVGTIEFARPGRRVVQGRFDGRYCTRFSPGGLQVPPPAGRIDGGVSFGQYSRITR